ncbi:unnamed protein product [Symbiodinium sp. CCMP2592]|nr:unnamed protein product [Symbiodinium sp. CCMP2592]
MKVDFMDPVEKQAQETLLKNMDKVHRFVGANAVSDLKKTVPGYLTPQQRTCFLLDSPTSRAKVGSSFVQVVKEVVDNNKLSQFSIAVLCGCRLDYMSVLQAKLAATFPSACIFVTALTAGADVQSDKRRMNFALVLHQGTTDLPATPTMVPALRGRAKAWEGIRLRCLTLSCPLRDLKEQERAKQVSEDSKVPVKPGDTRADPTKCELDPDDCEGQGQDEAMSEEEDTDPAPLNLGASFQQRDFLVDLFTFAKSASFYTPILQCLLCVSRSVTTVILTTTAHPGSSVAARLLGQEVFACLPTVTSHASLHGMKLQEEMFYRSALAEARVTADAGDRKRSHVSAAIQLIEGGCVPDSDVFDLTDVEPPETDSFAGLDVFHGALDTRVPLLLQKELSDSNLCLDLHQSFGRGLVTGKPLAEGEIICTATAAKFTCYEALAKFLRLPGHGFLADGVVKVDNARVKGSRASVYCVLLGAARYVQHFQGIRKQPNCAWQVDSACGSGSGYLKLVVRTHNGAGVARNSQLCTNYGLAFDFAQAAEMFEDDRVKRFRGALDAVLSKSQSQVQIAENITDFKFLLRMTPASFVLVSGEVQNRRLAPRTCLWWTRSAVLERGDSNSPFAVHFKRSSDWVFYYKGKDQAFGVAQLKDLIQEKSVASIPGHGSWPAGQCPPTFNMEKTTLCLKCKDPADEKILQTASKCSTVSLMWIMKAASEQELAVYGVALANNKQMIVMPDRNVLS